MPTPIAPNHPPSSTIQAHILSPKTSTSKPLMSNYSVEKGPNLTLPTLNLADWRTWILVIQTLKTIKSLSEAAPITTDSQVLLAYPLTKNKPSTEWKITWAAKITHAKISTKRSKSKTRKLLNVSTASNHSIPRKNFKSSTSLYKKFPKDSRHPKSLKDPANPSTIVQFTAITRQGLL